MSGLISNGTYVLAAEIGYNETVLWEGTGSKTVTLSESVKNFERVAIYVKWSWPDHIKKFEYLTDIFADQYGIIAFDKMSNDDSAITLDVSLYNVTSTSLSFSLSTRRFLNASNITSGTADDALIYKVVGVNRKSS